jgi:hypothetical protein
MNLKTAVESGRLAEPLTASALSDFVRRTNRCAFAKSLSASAATCSRNTSPPTAVFRMKKWSRNHRPKSSKEAFPVTISKRRCPQNPLRQQKNLTPFCTLPATPSRHPRSRRLRFYGTVLTDSKDPRKYHKTGIPKNKSTRSKRSRRHAKCPTVSLSPVGAKCW